MKNKMTKMISTLLLSLLSISTAQASSTDQDIQALLNNYEVALNASNTEAILALYSQNPTFMPQHAPAQVGREAITKAYQSVFSSINLNVSFTLHEQEVVGDTAWVRTTSAGKSTILANKMIINEGNNELFILKKEKGNWKIHQYLFATNQATK